MNGIKVLVGFLAVFLAWALIFQTSTIYKFNKWARDILFNDEWILFSGRRISVLLFILGGVALFSGLYGINNSSSSNPNFLVVRLNQGDQELKKGHFQHASEKAREALSLDPQSARAWELLATSWALMGETDRAINALKTLKAIDPHFQIVGTPLEGLEIKGKKSGANKSK